MKTIQKSFLALVMLLAFTFLFNLDAHAQSCGYGAQQISGTTYNINTGATVSGIFIHLSRNGAFIDIEMTDATGYYSFAVPASCDYYTVSAQPSDDYNVGAYGSLAPFQSYGGQARNRILLVTPNCGSSADLIAGDLWGVGYFDDPHVELSHLVDTSTVVYDVGVGYAPRGRPSMWSVNVEPCVEYQIKVRSLWGTYLTTTTASSNYIRSAQSTDALDLDFTRY